MAKINIPKEYLGKEKLYTLPAKEKEEYITNLIKKILELNPDGVTLSQIIEATNLTSSTVWHHLEILKSNSQCRKISRGNIDVYYTFGKVDKLAELEHDNVKYTIGIVTNEDGSFVCFHESRESRGTHKTLRGIAIPLGLIDDLTSVLDKIKKRSEKEK